MIRDEALLWQQELDLYKRRMQSTLSELVPDKSPPRPAPTTNRTIDPEIAAWLLRVPQAVLAADNAELNINWSREKYEADFKRLYMQELPYFQERMACGNCGSTGDLSDSDWFDFLNYTQLKALTLQLPPLTRDQRDGAAMQMMHAASPEMLDQLKQQQPPLHETLQKAIGRELLKKVEVEAKQRSALERRDPDLDSIRLGVRAILGFYQDTGLVLKYGVAFFGASRYEERNHEVWAVGEPAYLKYWLDQPATLRSTMALQAENGYSLDLVFATVQAYLDACGVDALGFRTFPALNAPGLVAGQCTLRRVRPLVVSNDARTDYPPFQIDTCPPNRSMLCY